jgi:multidrug efflux system membrane fusion protein
MSLLHSPPRKGLIYSMVALLFAAGVWYFGFQTEPAKTASGGHSFHSRGNTAPVPVRAVPAERQNLDVHLRAIGTATPLNTVTVRSRVEGQLLRVLFDEGQQVGQGDVLAEIDPLSYKIRLNQVEGQHRQNVAQLQTARADLERFKQLYAQTLVTQQQLEAQQALVADREGALASDQALVDDARRQLAYTKIEAPISGRLGLRQIDAGNLVRPGDAGGLAVITQTRPIAVMFTVPEIDLQKVLEPLRAGQHLEVEAWDRGEQVRLATGVLKTIDNQIDLATGTLRVKAEFPNEDERLFPNQFVNIRLRVRTLTDAIVVPTAAVQYGSRGTYVYLVNATSKATVRDVVLGPSDGSRQAIAEGLKLGEMVILEGLDRLREGRSVSLVGAAEAAGTKPAGERPAKGERPGKGEKSRKKDK